MTLGKGEGMTISNIYKFDFKTKDKKLRFSVDSREFGKCSMTKNFYTIKISAGKIEFIFAEKNEKINFLFISEVVSHHKSVFRNNCLNLNNQISLGYSDLVVLNSGKDFDDEISLAGSIEYLPNKIIYKITK